MEMCSAHYYGRCREVPAPLSRGGMGASVPVVAKTGESTVVGHARGVDDDAIVTVGRWVLYACGAMRKVENYGWFGS